MTQPFMVALVVEDMAPNRMLLVALLRACGVPTVEAAADGAALADRLARPPAPDLVLLDAGLPDADGFELCARIKADSGPAPVVIMTTTDEGASTQRRLVASGADGLLAKPIRPDAVTALVARGRPG